MSSPSDRIFAAKHFLTQLEMEHSPKNVARVARGIHAAKITEDFGSGWCWVDGTSRGPCSNEAMYGSQTKDQNRPVRYCTNHAARTAWAAGLPPFPVIPS